MFPETIDQRQIQFQDVHTFRRRPIDNSSLWNRVKSNHTCQKNICFFSRQERHSPLTRCLPQKEVKQRFPIATCLRGWHAAVVLSGKCQKVAPKVGWSLKFPLSSRGTGSMGVPSSFGLPAVLFEKYPDRHHHHHHHHVASCSSRFLFSKSPHTPENSFLMQQGQPTGPTYLQLQLQPALAIWLPGNPKSPWIERVWPVVWRNMRKPRRRGWKPSMKPSAFGGKMGVVFKLPAFFESQLWCFSGWVVKIWVENLVGESHFYQLRDGISMDFQRSWEFPPFKKV